MQHLAEWTAKMLDASEKTADLIGCSPEAIVAQAALETGWGASAIGNNVFGIKADSSWHGARQLTQTWEHLGGADVPMQCWFRDYPTLADGIYDHFVFLKENTRYANVFDPNNSMSDDEYLRRLASDGYATAPNYAGSLLGTLTGVRAISQHISIDGAVPAAPARVLLIGCTGADVTALQFALKALGYYQQAIDGDFGAHTYAAVYHFQINRGLETDGIVGAMTRAALGL